MSTKSQKKAKAVSQSDTIELIATESLFQSFPSQDDFAIADDCVIAIPQQRLSRAERFARMNGIINPQISSLSFSERWNERLRLAQAKAIVPMRKESGTKSSVPEACFQVIADLLKAKTSPKQIKTDPRLQGIPLGTIQSLIGKLGGVYRACQGRTGTHPRGYDKILSDLKKGIDIKKAKAPDGTDLYQANMIQAVVRYRHYFE